MFGVYHRVNRRRLAIYRRILRVANPRLNIRRVCMGLASSSALVSIVVIIIRLTDVNTDYQGHIGQSLHPILK